MRCAINYYRVAVLGYALKPLTYHSIDTIKLFSYVLITVSGKPKEAVVLESVSKPDFNTAPIDDVLPKQLMRDDIDTAHFIASYYICAVGEALNLFVPQSTPIDVPLTQPIKIPSPDVVLSPTQQKALEFCNSNPISLLFADTGSGKTEIYIHAIYQALQANKQALFLMPEISLTPQMQARLTHHFGEAIAVWHSKITKPKKTKILEGIKAGTIRIVAGPRSVLFLPLAHLGLIIVDEEHDDSYKSNQKPRYNAKDMAVLRATRLKIPLILGSATPSLSSYIKYPFFRIKGGYYDAKRTLKYEAATQEISQNVLNHLANSYHQGHQSLIFVPTRANFKYIVCQECHEAVTCPFCSVGMSLHTAKRVLKCHYCNFTQSIPHQCSACKSKHLSATRIGTAEVVHALESHFKDKRIALFDRDAIKTDTALKKILKEFNAHQIDTIVGTQMLSKGHDYHDITLAVVMGIDNILQQSDFRAREKALALLTQIIGRAGRKKAATIIIQTHHQEFFEYYLTDYELFIKDELSFRAMYVPFVKLARILFAHKSNDQADKAMNQMLEKLKNFKDDVEIVGFGKAPIEKIANKYRYSILLRAKSSAPLLKAIKSTLHPLAQVDIDPVEFA